MVVHRIILVTNIDCGESLNGTCTENFVKNKNK